MHRNGPSSHAWYVVSAENIWSNTIVKSNDQRHLYFRTARNCEQISDDCLASSGTIIAAWNHMSLVNARQGPSLLDFKWSGLPISVEIYPASGERRLMGMRRLVPP